jgi:acetylornithine deacetylase/succinyl-diaminopimelate desuccinylase-like protein
MASSSDLDTLTNHTVELLQALIRNRCVNDGSPDSGEERRNADLLQTYLEGAGLDVERLTPHGDRTSIVARIEGTDPDAPKLCMMGHTDVVPVNPDGWTRDPFGGDLVDGEVWGRGALDMLCLTSSMAVAFKELAQSGFRPRGDLIYFGVADEEAGGAHGAEWIVDHHWDAVKCDYMVTELGGFWAGDGRSVLVSTAEKGVAWRRLAIGGTPSHGSMPYGTDNAVVTAAEIIRRISTHVGTAHTGPLWDALLRSSNLPADTVAMLADPARLNDALTELPPLVARRFHACSHTTMSCNVVHGGQKTNIVPDRVLLDVDIRTMPGVDEDDVDELLLAILGDLAPRVTIMRLDHNRLATESTTDSPLWGSLARQVGAMYPQAQLTPALMVGGTDGAFFREQGTVVYGAGLFSPSVDRAAIAERFHGNDERIDVESLRLCTDLWMGLARDVVG